MTALRVVVADDDVLLREGLCSLLIRSGFDVVGQAGDAAQLLSLVRNRLPDVAIVDIRMPPTKTTEGLEAAHVIRTEQPAVAILVLSAHVDVEHAKGLLVDGRGIGYLLKSRVVDVAALIDTLNRIAAGASVIDPSVVEELVASRRRSDLLTGLTVREGQVLALMAEGWSNGAIAQRLSMAEGTLGKHVRHIFTKMRLPETSDDHRRVRAVITFLS